MLIDARAEPPPREVEADVCIVGAGAAGIILARELAGSGRSVLLLEGGGLGLEPETQALYEGRNEGHPYFPLTACRLRMLGGTTNHWAGWCRPLEPEDLAGRPWIDHSGWPFGWEELGPYYERAGELCELASPARWDLDFWVGRSSHVPLDLGAAGFASQIFQRSPPTRFGTAYRETLEAAPDLDVHLHANAVRIETTSSGDRVRHVVVRALGGSEWRVAARVFVLAAGGIENPRLLLASRPPSHPRGVGNRHDRVGRFFMEHPHLVDGIFLPADPHLDAAFYTTQKTEDGRFSGTLTLGEDVLRQERIHGVSMTLEPTGRRAAEVLAAESSAGMASLRVLAGALRDGRLPEDLGHHLARVLGDLDDVATVGWSYLTESETEGSMYRIFFRTEQAPHPESRVTLTEERDALGVERVALAWTLGEGDLRTVERGHEILAREVGRTGLGRVFFPGGDGDRAWARRLFGGNHHMGTTRMHPDPRQGVVDANGRLHDVENLYVAGSSVFPTCGYANPTLTIVALALRLADHLKGAS